MGRKRNPKPEFSAYGGALQTTRWGRRMRPLAYRHSMHLVLRSSQARGPWSFLKHKEKVDAILKRFAKKYHVRLLDFANVGNHLHLHLELKNRKTYRAFIRAISSAIMMAVTGISRWNPLKLAKKFWDRRPFTRIVLGIRQFKNMEDYISINQLEGSGHPRDLARYIVKKARAG